MKKELDIIVKKILDEYSKNGYDINKIYIGIEARFKPHKKAKLHPPNSLLEDTNFIGFEFGDGKELDLTDFIEIYKGKFK